MECHEWNFLTIRFMCWAPTLFLFFHHPYYYFYYYPHYFVSSRSVHFSYMSKNAAVVLFLTSEQASLQLTRTFFLFFPLYFSSGKQEFTILFYGLFNIHEFHFVKQPHIKRGFWWEELCCVLSIITYSPLLLLMRLQVLSPLLIQQYQVSITHHHQILINPHVAENYRII